MYPVIKIENINAPEIDAYRSLKLSDPSFNGIFIVESLPAVSALLESTIEPVSCLTTSSFLDKHEGLMSLIEKRRIKCMVMEKALIQDLIGFKFHHGIMMAAKVPLKSGISDMIAQIPETHTVLALNGIHDPQNVGLIIRNASAFGVNAMLIDDRTFSPYYRKVARISMGSLFKVPIYHTHDLTSSLSELKRELKTKIMVSSLKEGSIPSGSVDMSGNICLVIGNEKSGVTENVSDIADTLVRIPHIFDKTDSLNVSCAAAILLYETYRARDFA